MYGGKYVFVEEIDTGKVIEYGQDGNLTSDSWVKIFEFRKILKSESIKEFI